MCAQQQWRPLLRALRIIPGHATAGHDRLPTFVPCAGSDPATEKRVFFLLGKALNAGPEYSKECEEALSRCIKLDPKNVDCWNELGECIWKRSDLKASRRCFQTALSKQRNAVSLRCLSVLLRHRPPNMEAQQHAESIAESIKLAKEAVAMDLQSGTSWFFLGNAHLAQFFLDMADSSQLRQAEKSYRRAGMDPVESANNPDLHHNRAVVSHLRRACFVGISVCARPPVTEAGGAFKAQFCRCLGVPTACPSRCR